MISIIIVNYNTGRFLFPCLDSIRKYVPADTEVIVVDNNSSDGSIEKLKSQKSKGKTTTQKLKVIENSENLGYAKAVNQGLRIASGDYLFVLNPDTELTKGSIDELLKFTETLEDDVGLVAPRLLNPDSSVQNSCYHEPTFLSAFKEYFLGMEGAFEKYTPEGNDPIRIDAVVGAAMFIPRKTIEKVGMLDERFFMYFEDLDYCRRVRLSSLKVYYLPIAQVYHEHGAITSTVGERANEWLIQSSKIYHGIVGYILLTAILKLGQKVKNLLASKTKQRIS